MWDMIQSCPPKSVHENTSSTFRLGFSSTWRSFCFQPTWKQTTLFSTLHSTTECTYTIKGITIGMWKFSLQILKLVFDWCVSYVSSDDEKSFWSKPIFFHFCPDLQGFADVHDLQEKFGSFLVFPISWGWRLFGFSLFLVVLIVFFEKRVLVFEPYICRYYIGIGQECDAKSLFWKGTISYWTSYITHQNSMIDMWVWGHSSTNYVYISFFPHFYLCTFNNSSYGDNCKLRLVGSLIVVIPS